MVDNNSTPHARAGNGAANQAGSFLFPMKPPLSFSEQIDLMRSRGLSIEDETSALKRLSQTNYYRLRGYWLTFERDGAFIPGTTFDMVWDVYSLDIELKALLWRAIEPVEIKARTSFAYHMAMALGPSSYSDPDFFRNGSAHSRSMANVGREVDRALKDGVPCVRHNIEKYGELPIWAAVEVMTMGTVSQLYGNLDGASAIYGDGKSVQSAIAGDFRVKPRYLKSWLRHLTYIRNICAHHSRLYNRVITSRAALLKADAGFDNGKEFPTFLVLKRIYERSWPGEWSGLLDDFREIVERHHEVRLGPMGFPDRWEEALNI